MKIQFTANMVIIGLFVLFALLVFISSMQTIVSQQKEQTIVAPTVIPTDTPVPTAVPSPTPQIQPTIPPQSSTTLPQFRVRGGEGGDE